jgi:hypothetical protein
MVGERMTTVRFILIAWLITLLVATGMFISFAGLVLVGQWVGTLGAFLIWWSVAVTGAGACAYKVLADD